MTSDLDLFLGVSLQLFYLLDGGLLTPGHLGQEGLLLLQLTAELPYRVVQDIMGGQCCFSTFFAP